MDSNTWARMALTRRELLLAGVPAAAVRPLSGAPGAPVAIARCRSYGRELLPVMRTMFDQIGGLSRLVSSKTVTVKINLTGGATTRLGHQPAELAHWSHPAVIGAAVHLMGLAGARRIRLVESIANNANPLEEEMIVAGWEPNDLLNAARHVEFENTGFLGRGKRYHRLVTPNGGHMFKAFDLNHAYDECDVFVSIAKLKEHATTGVTLAMKNCFGITPNTIYGNGAGIREPAIVPNGGRTMLHTGNRQPSLSSPSENDPSSPREGGYRVPRIVADLAAARPIHLSIIDGIETMSAGEGPWILRSGRHRPRRISPGLLIAGTNPVCTDAVATAVMGFDPAAGRGSTPFENCDSTLRLAEELGVGTPAMSRIEVAGLSIREAVFPFRNHW